MNNGLKIEENKDGSFTIEWERNHLVWGSLFNNMTQEEIEKFVIESIEKHLENMKENKNESTGK